MNDLEDLANTQATFTFTTGDVFKMPFVAAWSIYHTAGYRAVFEIALLGAQIANKDMSTDRERRLEVEEEINRLAQMLFIGLKQKHPTPEDLLCYFSYQLLKAHHATRAEVAQLASYLLGRTIEAEAWRKRVNKYIENEKLEPLELPKGRKAKKPEK